MSNFSHSHSLRSLACWISHAHTFTHTQTVIHECVVSLLRIFAHTPIGPKFISRHTQSKRDGWLCECVKVYNVHFQNVSARFRKFLFFFFSQARFTYGGMVRDSYDTCEYIIHMKIVWVDFSHKQIRFDEMPLAHWTSGAHSSALPFPFYLSANFPFRSILSTYWRAMRKIATQIKPSKTAKRHRYHSRR